MAAQRTYLAIDLKSFYASVECVDRHLDPLTTNLVVADASRTEKTICLAVSPSLKAYKIPGRARLFEAVQRVREVNAQRLQTAIRQHKAVRGEDGKYHFASTSFDANALNADPALGLSYIVAPPRMQRYLDVSTQIYKTYLKYVSPADIYPYSIDEVFIDVTGYLPYYHMSAHELAMTMVREVLYNTGITATAGIGTNLYLAKLAMDIVAKHIPADKDGVRIAELDEQSYRYLLWNHRPLTDFWMTGPGTVKRLEAHGIYTMGDLARFSIHGEDRLYEIFGVDAEILIDHAWGYEPCGMEQIWDAKILVGIKMSAVAVAGLTLFSMMGQMLLESVGNLKMRQAIPIPAQILAGIVLWLTTLWEIPFCLLLAQKISTFLMLVIHVGIYSILSTSVSLKPWFALFPGAITSRLMCVVIKVMPNGLPFEPGQVTYSPELGRVSGLLIGIPAALLWFLVFWLAGRTWFRKQVAE